MRQRNLDELSKMSDDDIRNLLKSSKDEILRLYPTIKKAKKKNPHIFPYEFMQRQFYVDHIL